MNPPAPKAGKLTDSCRYMTNPFEIFPTLNTSRLTLRQFNLKDAGQLLFLRSDDEVNKFIKRQTPREIQDAIDFVKKIHQTYEQRENVNWVITLKNDPEMIGSICLWNFSADRKTGEVGYDLHPSFQNKGIMTEALKAVLYFGFYLLNLEKIVAFTHHENENSKNLLIKNGFKLQDEEIDPDNEDNIIFSISKS